MTTATMPDNVHPVVADFRRWLVEDRNGRVALSILVGRGVSKEDAEAAMQFAYEAGSLALRDRVRAAMHENWRPPA
jgi:hypothetical protein